MDGFVPSDQDPQNKARIIIYDDGDPWNRTPADNKLWLDTLKYQTGIAANAPVERLEEVPIMPPYVVRGGLRNPRASVGGVSGKRSGSGSAGGSGVLTPTLPVADFGERVSMDMDLDFNQIDFNDMDLGMVDESGFVAGRSLDGSAGLMDDFLQQPQMQSLGFGFENPLGGGMKGMPMQQERFGMNMN